jgi:hypothetical protein
MKRLELSTEALDLAIDSAKLHYNLTQLLIHHVYPARPEPPAYGGEQQIPF